MSKKAYYCFEQLCLLFLFALLSCLSGCKVGPNYYPPADEVSDEWSSQAAVGALPVEYDPPPVYWWGIFNDPLLNQYIEMAAYYNNDVLKAETNIFQSRSLRQVAMAPLLPSLSLDADAFHVFFSKNGPIALLGAASAAQASSTGGHASSGSSLFEKMNLYNTFLDASWELDIFGKTRRSIEAAQAGLESSVEQKNDILISVFAEIVRNYIELRSSQKQKMLLESNIAMLQKNADIMQKRYVKGYSNLIDLEQINIQLNQAISALPSANISIYRSIFAISVLTGNGPEALLEELLEPQALPALPSCLAAGMRSDLLRRRPDVRVAERNLAQATANIGVAVASFYPSVSLVGILGLQTLHLSNLFSPNSKAWIDGVDCSMPIFQGGRLVGNLRIAETQAAAAAFAYRQTVLSALRDAETALIAYGEDLKTAEDLRKVVASNHHVADFIGNRYAKGLVGQLDDLNGKMLVNNAELSLLQSETAALLDLVSLYKALGGGWEPFAFCLDK